MVGSQHDHKPPRFPFSRTYSVADILELGLPTPVSVTGSTAIFVDHVAPLEHAGTNAVTFCRSVGTKCVDQCNSSEATMIIVAEPMTETEDRCYIQVLDPLAWFSALVDRLELTDARVDSMVEGLNQIASLSDPIGTITDLAILRNCLSNDVELNKWEKFNLTTICGFRS